MFYSHSTHEFSREAGVCFELTSDLLVQLCDCHSHCQQMIEKWYWSQSNIMPLWFMEMKREIERLDSVSLESRAGPRIVVHLVANQDPSSITTLKLSSRYFFMPHVRNLWWHATGHIYLQLVGGLNVLFVCVVATCSSTTSHLVFEYQQQNSHPIWC